MAVQYANLTPADFDKFDCVKISKGIWLILAFILRGYVIWAMSVTNMQDRVGTIQLIYPDPKLFYLSLASGAVGIFVAFVLALRRPNAANWVKACCRQLRTILIVALLFDVCVNLAGVYWWNLQSFNGLLINTVIAIVSTLFLCVSKRVKINLAEFPETLPEK